MGKDTSFILDEGVHVSSDSLMRFHDFEKNYLLTREKEKRVLNIDEIRKLPEVSADYIHANEWGIRKKNIQRFLKHLHKKPHTQRILDIGCGNGFFTHLMSQDNTVVGVDVNLFELKQAVKAFPTNKITWYFSDILNDTLPELKFNIITFCASFQYFDNPIVLLKKCQDLLLPNGEIHIIDSPFYTMQTIEKAKENSASYYHNIDSVGMKKYYHHNTIECLNGFKYQFKYQPGSLLNKILRKKDSPFPWVLIST